MLILRTVDIPDEDMIIENSASGTVIAIGEQTLFERDIFLIYWSKMPLHHSKIIITLNYDLLLEH